MKLWEIQLEHPFIGEMSDGSLDLEKFKFYAKQNYLYLQRYAKVLALAVAKTTNLATMRKLSELMHFTLNTEIELNRSYAEELGVSMGELEREEMAPTTRAYTDFLLATSMGDLCELVAALLPCYWGYHEIFSKLKLRGMPRGNPIYTKTIELYSSDRSKRVTNLLRDILDRIVKEKTKVEKAKLKQIFLTSSRYEYLIWEMAYRQEAWPGKKMLHSHNQSSNFKAD